MTLSLFVIISTIWCVLAAPQGKVMIEKNNEIISSQQNIQQNEDLKTAANSCELFRIPMFTTFTISKCNVLKNSLF